MVKPIFIVGLPRKMAHNDAIRNEVTQQIKVAFENEYHVLVYVNDELYDIKFQAFYEKDFNEVRFEELKQIVENSIKPKEEEEMDGEF